MGIARSDHATLCEKAAEQVVRFIQENQMQRGDRLPNERKLMEQLNVSRSTIREAMRSLSSRGIVVIRQGSGMYIANLPGVTQDPLGLSFKYDEEKVLMDLLELRLIMEPSIAALAARKASDEDVRTLIALASQVASQINRGEKHIETDVAFHCRIAESAGNDILNVLFPEIVKGVRLFTDLLGDRIVHAVAVDHEKIAEAIAQRDTLRASTAMTVHLERNRYAIEEHFVQKAKEQQQLNQA